MADSPRERGSRPRLTRLAERFGVYLVALALLGVGGLVSRDFLTTENLLSVLDAVALLGIAAVGMAFVTYSGSLADLSLPSIMAFSGIVAVAALPLGLVPALLSGFAAGVGIGLVNGIVVGLLEANPILWTLAVSFFMEGLMRFVWSNDQIYPDTAEGSAGAAFIDLYRTRVGPLPLSVVAMLALLVLAHGVLTRTRFGAEAKLTGSARAAARTSGVPTGRVVVLSFVACAAAASVAGLLITSMNKLGVFYLGKGYDFRAVTAVVIGGVFLSGGRGGMPGVLGGVLVIGLLSSLLTFLGVSAFEQDIATGAVFIAIVGVHQARLRRQGRDHA